MLKTICPSCQEVITLAKLKGTGADKALIQHDVSNCPGCNQRLQLPTYAEIFMSIGLLLSVMVVPLAHYWEYENTVIYCLFAAGVLLLLAGIIKNQ